MSEGRVYQASFLLDTAISEPSSRIYQAWTDITEAAAPAARIYQAYIATAAAGTGKGRIYQASLSSALPLDFAPSGVLAWRGGKWTPVAMRSYRAGEL